MIDFCHQNTSVATSVLEKTLPWYKYKPFPCGKTQNLAQTV
jgi:hypothetical protein